MFNNQIFLKRGVSESVGIGHPDKISDLIADTLLEHLISIDKTAQVALEVLSSDKLIFVAGEVTLKTSCVNLFLMEGKVKEVLRNLGYVDDIGVIFNIKGQSKDIRQSAINGKSGIVSGDQSIVVGYAENTNEDYMPLSFLVSRDLVMRVEYLIKCGKFLGAGFDCKSLVVLDGKKVEKLVLSVQNRENLESQKFMDFLKTNIVDFVCNKYGLDVFDEGVISLDSSKLFNVGGLHADTGSVNRKLLVDSYGVNFLHGGGGYSGKDLTKIDRLGAYFARWICKNFVAAGICDSMELVLVFKFGDSKPFIGSLITTKNEDNNSEVEILWGKEFRSTKNSMNISCDQLKTAIEVVFNFKFEEVYEMFNVDGLPFSSLSCYGHFGRSDIDVPWERLDKVEEIKKYFGANF